ncbi:hypothetical protein DQP58_00090 [Mycobacterium colombiense]|uniref:Uncharacterized protein n=1 Tax=Mycobacterium colombiense TaxID=339268 RepID=A0A329KY45_9MYCO|nr:hypothetical protein [Mycobacterium colombiense]RAV00674.1 hypothetical protein DQP58_00090 [Mycobacterium colombiense]
MIDPTAALDFATKHHVVAQRILRDCDDADLSQLAFDLLNLYAVVAKRLHSEIGWVTIVSALHDVREYANDPNDRHAGALILAHSMAADARGVDADLREIGMEELAKRFTVINATDRTLATITAIPIVWQRLLPVLTTPAGIDLLERFSIELQRDES